MKIKVATLGSCVTRDPFNSLFNPNYKDFYQLSVNQFHTSIVSLMSKPIEYDSTSFVYEKPVKEFAEWHFKTELNKRFLNDLVLAQPQYVIVDLYADITFGVREVGTSYVTGKEYAYKKNKLWNTLQVGKRYDVESDFAEYFDLFKTAADNFYEFCKEHLPKTTIVVNQARYTYEYWDELDKSIKVFGEKTPETYIKLNQIWGILDNYLLAKDNVKAISYDKKYYADPHYRFGGLGPVHFKNNYYEDFLKKLLVITFGDLIDQKIDLNNVYPDGNLIQNSSFMFGNSSWKVFKPNIFNIKNGEVVVESHGNEENKWNQIVSDAIEIENGSTYYFSFEFEEIDLSDMNNDEPIVAIRCFERRNVFKAKDATMEIGISKSEVLEQLKDKNTNRFCKQLVMEGKYIKVNPYLKKNGAYRIAKLQLSHNNCAYQIALNEQ